MTKKEAFIKMVEELLNPLDTTELDKMALEYFEELKNSAAPKEKVELTESGAKILKYMQENEANKSFTSKEIAEGLFTSSRSVSSSMRKLITEGFVEKLTLEPITYGLTDKGTTKDLSNVNIEE
jgi:Mn-dependent DtxR family transcriptional regulator